jgi:putative redox protein
MPLVSTLAWKGGLRTAIRHEASGAEGLTDAPVDNRGQGRAFSPTDLLATSLASCLCTIMGIAALDRGWSLDGMTARIHKTMASDPRRVAGVRVEVHVPGEWDEKARRVLEHAARTCPVALSLHPDLEQDLVFRWGGDQEGTSVAG